MIKSKQFWVEERDAPLLVLNHGFLEGQGEKIFERVGTWPALAGIDMTQHAASVLPEVENPDRIWIADADRTFKTVENRKQFVKLLAFLNTQFKDYHQGLGYVSSFLSLTMEEAQLIALLSHINEKVIPGYWRHEAIKFATDAYVFQTLLGQHHPDVLAHLQKHLVDPSTFCQKWFVGLCVHVLPLEYLFSFFEAFLKEGHPYLMKFGLSLIKNLKTRLLEASNVESIFAILRLDKKAVPHERVLFESILADTKEYDLTGVDFPTLRQQAYDTHLKKRVEAAHAVLQEVDEIEDCALCKDDFPEMTCTVCKLNICESCHEKPPKDSKHLSTHKTKELDEDEDEDEDEDKDDKEKEEESDEADALADSVSKLKV